MFPVESVSIVSDSVQTTNNRTSVREKHSNKVKNFGCTECLVLHSHNLSLKTISEWSVEDVKNWLTMNGQVETAEKFYRHSIDGSVLFDINKELLNEMGISTIGKRHAIVELIKNLRVCCAKRLFQDPNEQPDGNIEIYVFDHNQDHHHVNLKNPRRFSAIVCDILSATMSDANDWRRCEFFYGRKLSEFDCTALTESEVVYLINRGAFRDIYGKKLYFSIVSMSSDSELISPTSTSRSSLPPSPTSYQDENQFQVQVCNEELELSAPPSKCSTIRSYKGRNASLKKKHIGSEIIETNWESFIPEEQAIEKKTTHNSLLLIPNQKSDESDSYFDWIRGKCLGRGSFGTVYLGVNKKNGVHMAVKKAPLPSLKLKNGDNKKKDAMKEALQQEIRLMAKLSHPNIVKYLGTQIDEDDFLIFLEYVPGGSLLTLLEFGAFEEPLIQNFLRPITHALNYLHDHGIIHRDIKAANILLDDKGNPKIADFGISLNTHNDKYNQMKRQSKLMGSVYWMAPEAVLSPKTITTKADIWSLGCTILEMLTGEPPWPGLQPETVLYLVGKKNAPKYSVKISVPLCHFLNKCFVLDPELRDDTKSLLKSPFIKF